jgi:hypothetical protein
MDHPGEFVCFFSLEYGRPELEQVYDIARAVGGELGLTVSRGLGQLEPTSTVRSQVRNAISEAVACIADVSGFNWWVAFEVFYALERKDCIILEQERPGADGESRFSSVYDIPRIIYRLGEPADRDKLKARLRIIFSGRLAKAADWSARITASSLNRETAALPEILFNQSIRASKRGKGARPSKSMPVITGSRLFESWLPLPSGKVRQIAVIAPSGAGKSVLLARFGRWLHRMQSSGPTTYNDLLPIALFFRAVSLPEDLDLWAFIQREVRSREQETRGKSAALLRPFFAARRVYVLVDGLDEYFVDRRGANSRLMARLQKLADSGINVIVSCRQNLWLQEISDTDSYELVQIERLDAKQVKEHFIKAGIHLPPDALDDEGNPKEFILSPLIVSMLLGMRRNHGRVLSFGSRTDLYEGWAKSVCIQEAPRYKVSAETLLEFLERCAIARLHKRSSFLPVDALRALMPPALLEQSVSVIELSVFGVLSKDSSISEVNFFHESVYEFFIARALVNEFRRALRPTGSTDEASTLTLATVELDYPQSAIYGFLSEKLGTSYLLKLVAHLEKHWGEINAKVLRNLIEYVGMTYSGDASALALLLLDLAERHSSVEVRFNALRALERVHPGAPRPYFMHVSDWGAKDYVKLDAIARLQELRPWVMRGHGKKMAAAGRQWSWVPNDPTVRDTELQRPVSARLGRLLQNSLLSTSDLGVRVNCSHSWIRWFHEDDRGVLEAVMTEVERRSLDSIPSEGATVSRPTLDNLRDWVGQARTRTEVGDM